MRQRAIRSAGAATRVAEFLRRRRTPAEIARLLSGRGVGAAGGRGGILRAATVRAHVAQGAPADSRGRLSLAGYAAWLIRQRRAKRAPDAEPEARPDHAT